MQEFERDPDICPLRERAPRQGRGRTEELQRRVAGRVTASEIYIQREAEIPAQIHHCGKRQPGMYS